MNSGTWPGGGTIAGGAADGFGFGTSSCPSDPRPDVIPLACDFLFLPATLITAGFWANTAIVARDTSSRGANEPILIVMLEAKRR